MLILIRSGASRLDEDFVRHYGLYVRKRFWESNGVGKDLMKEKRG
jgi:hypothetical protein